MTFDINTGIGNIADLIKTVVTRVVKDPQQQAEIQLQVEQLHQTGELVKMANDTQLFQAEVDDRKSARQRESDVALSDKAPYINKIITPILAIGVLALTFILYGMVMFNTGTIDPSRKDIMIYVLGALTSIDIQIVSYYFGSTSSSNKKTDAMADALKK